MKISLILNTYERPDGLATVLRSVARQTMKPFEVVVGDDGSGSETAEIVRKASAYVRNLKYVWLPHDGFRLARNRNAAVAKAEGDYLVLIDDGFLLHPDFIADHAAAARPGYFACGKRIGLDPELTAKAISSESYWPPLFARGIRRRRHLLRLGPLPRMVGWTLRPTRRAMSLNFALWLEDYRRVNGFNEDFVGWGREDSEFAHRLVNSGVKRHTIRFSALGCHLHHPRRSRENNDANDVLLNDTIARKLKRCENGLNLHVKRPE